MQKNTFCTGYDGWLFNEWHLKTVVAVLDLPVRFCLKCCWWVSACETRPLLTSTALRWLDYLDEYTFALASRDQPCRPQSTGCNEKQNKHLVLLIWDTVWLKNTSTAQGTLNWYPNSNDSLGLNDPYSRSKPKQTLSQCIRIECRLFILLEEAWAFLFAHRKEKATINQINF